MTTSSPTLAVALIVKNEAKHLKACLDTVAGWVDEIVIMDSGSTDSTETIAREFTDKFIVNKEWPGFGKQRQLAQQHVISDYVLWLDADERVTPELKIEILAAVKANKANTAYKINRSSSAFGKFIKHSGWSPDWVVRLYKTNETQYSDSLVHESVVIPNHIQVNALTGRLLHFTYDALQQYNAKNVMYIKSWVDQREGKKKGSLSGAFLHGFFCFIRMYILKRGFLDGRHGLLLATLSASVTFNRYADLWLRDYNKSNKE
ncbi:MULTISPECIES: glycosyltransferase family 2 protein [Aliivibrio]|uniref:Glycosyltransferase family 2 protein n=1 Tax=Aliivibrio finisterrensis TaxID=511998 RepID=A0A4Q5KMR0_9GAMM|nr:MULTISPECIES: glycosyltransferase family 2 protein [Aliivibrio]MDD9180610.1 glycosyltransferase family 2 protein [Aliivibrio sp. A6]RYU47770.1 glycosyltransferase family 2 protein [Aliivibrio finisterrensis]RYU48802.1 glycosyltransferase family 2 protein [Aliivibrio finisterrensis]RYU53542.1 glycosyltransferase family 2 protein [Aliivibrio finisterrensis]RYU61803.1 glycosyltransferase family 2 protein [Aliivibrio finisterrensis]